MSREFLMLHEESSYGAVTLTGGAPTTGRFMFIRLDGGNSFTARPRPIRSDIMRGNGIAMPGLAVADSVEVRGTLRTVLYYGQATRLLNWCITRINTGRTIPWATNDVSNLMPVGDLASMATYHAIQQNDGSYLRRRYNGGKVLSWSLAISRQSPVAILTMEIQYSTFASSAAPWGSAAAPNATEFPLPTDAQMPTGPVLFSQCAGGLGIGVAPTPVTRTLYESLNLRATNTLSPKFWESKTLSTLQFFGREASLEVRGQLKVSPNDRASYEALSAMDVSVAFTNGTNTITLDFNGANVIDDVQDDTPLESDFIQTMRLKSFYDVAVGGNQPDLSFAFS